MTISAIETNSKSSLSVIFACNNDTKDEKTSTSPDLESLALSRECLVAENQFLKVREMEVIKEQCSGAVARSIFLVCAFICGFGFYTDFTTRSVYTGYATNSYSEHSLLSTIKVVNGVVSVGSQIVFARLSDIFGRLELFLVGAVLYVVGTIIESQAHNVKAYAAGAVFYNAGYVGVSLLLFLMLSDMSTMKWRLFYQFVSMWPCIIISWISGDIVQSANPIKNWSWDIAMWAFIFPLSALPLVTFMTLAKVNALKSVEWKTVQNEKKNQHSNILVISKEILHKIDAVGTTLVIASLGFILVPLTLAGGLSEKWAKPGIIASLVIGAVLFFVFLAWEATFAKDATLPVELMKDRGVWAALFAALLQQMIYAISSDYLYTVLMVSMNESSKSATRIVWLPTFVSSLSSIFFGLLVTRTNRLKVYCICGGCLWILSFGLFYRYRGGPGSHAGIIGASIVMGLGSTIFVLCLVVSLQNMTTHNKMAAITGLYHMFAQIGTTTGASISGAIWTQLMFTQLAKHLKDNELAKAAYESPYEFIISYSWGSQHRSQMVEAYKYVQKKLMLTALILTVPLLILFFLMKDKQLGDTVGGDSTQSDDDPIWTWISEKHQHLKAKIKNTKQRSFNR